MYIILYSDNQKLKFTESTGGKKSNDLMFNEYLFILKVFCSLWCEIKMMCIFLFVRIQMFLILEIGFAVHAWKSQRKLRIGSVQNV